MPGELKGDFDSEDHRLDLHFDISGIQYGAVGIDSVVFDVTSDEDKLSYGFHVSDLRADTLRIFQLGLSGNVARDSIRTKFTVLDSLEKEKVCSRWCVQQFATGISVSFFCRMS